MIVPPARRALLEAMNDDALLAELAEVRESLVHHAAHELDLRARMAADALRASESYVLTIAAERGMEV